VRALVLAPLVFWLCLPLAGATGKPEATTATKPLASATAELGPVEAVVLGVVEGVTEFLPVSSTGHLIIASRVLGLDSETPITGRDGQPLWHRAPRPGRAGEPLTTKRATDTYLVVIQFGAIAAVALLYGQQLLAMLRGLLGRDPAGLRLLIQVVIGFIPAAGLGFLAHDWIEEHLFSIGTVIAAQVAGALLMFWAEGWHRRRRAVVSSPSRPLTATGAAGIGLLQCAALCPGTSRSMMTIVGGYFAGLDPRRAAEFSFLLGFVTLTAASVYKSYKGGAAMLTVFGWPELLLGGAVAALVAAGCVKFLVHWLTRHGLGLFAWYRLGVAATLAVYFYL
jgi:undecaprenyl-diphosphatase